MNEKTVTPWVRNSFQAIGAWVKKWPDAAIPPVSAGFRRMPIDRPFDLAICFRGVFVAVEIKFLNDYQAFGHRHLRDSQVENLEAVHRAGGSSWVAAVVWQPREFCRLLIWPWPSFPAASIGKAQMTEFGGLDRLKRDTSFYWDLSSWVERFEATRLAA